jgi:hypothetical protein
MSRAPTIGDVAIPVLAGIQNADRYSIKALYGTAFPLGHSMLLTAAHVVENAEQSAATMLIAWPPAGFNEPLNVSVAYLVQKWSGVDLAAIAVPNQMFPVLDWDARPLPFLTTVKTFGFPYGIDLDHRTLTHRALTGPISGSRQYLDFTGGPWVYELQFAAPRGVSGAALLTEVGRVAGCVVGNSISECASSRRRQSSNNRPV